MKLFAAKIKLKNGSFLHPLTVFAKHEGEAIERFLHHLNNAGHTDYTYSIYDRPMSEHRYYGYEDTLDPMAEVFEHTNLYWGY